MPVKLLKGFRDYLPEEMIAKERMLQRIRQVFETFGYPPIQTPALEYSEVLLGKYGEEGEMLMYRFLDHGDRDICLRYDLTVPLARVMAEHSHRLTLPFRRYQMAPVWRAEKPAKGRFREFLQCDVDLIGVQSAIADAEMILIDVAVLQALGVTDFQVRVNHRGALRGWTRTLGISDGAQEAAFLRLLDKLPRIGEEKFVGALGQEFGLEASAVEGLLGTTRGSAGARQTHARMQDELQGNPDGEAALVNLGEVLDLVEAAGELDRVVIDPSIARGLSYYTGIIYETIIEALPAFGSVMSGGRYDELLGMFSKQQIPAVGISLGVDRLFSALQELNRISTQQTPARVMVVNFGDDGGRREVQLSARLRAAGIPTLLYPVPAKLKKQLQYCQKMAIPFAVMVGKDEAESGTTSLKDLHSGEQRQLRVEELIRELSAGSEGSSHG
ncbi:MAG: histidine--tRNA ligase [Planctomycetota bacterium]